jgi:hypothetical protein
MNTGEAYVDTGVREFWMEFCVLFYLYMYIVRVFV